MEFNKTISELSFGDKIDGFYVMQEAAIRTDKNGKTFFDMTLADCTGVIPAKIWDYAGNISPDEKGNIVKVRAEVTEYRGQPQLSVSRIRLPAAGDSYDLSQLVPVAPIDAAKTEGEIRALVASLKDPDYRTVCETMLDRHAASFSRIPAAKSVHHGFLNGLLMHTANMLKIADFLSGIYAGTIDRSLLLTGTLLHDLAKDREFAFSKLGLVTEYTAEGQLLGHLYMGAREIAEVCLEKNIPAEKAMLLQHMVLSHHGEPEFGAAVRPQCAESELLSQIDLIDSRMEIYAETMGNMQAGQFSNKIYALDRRIYKHD